MPLTYEHSKRLAPPTVFVPHCLHTLGNRTFHQVFAAAPRPYRQMNCLEAEAHRFALAQQPVRVEEQQALWDTDIRHLNGKNGSPQQTLLALFFFICVVSTFEKQLFPYLVHLQPKMWLEALDLGRGLQSLAGSALLGTSCLLISVSSASWVILHSSFLPPHPLRANLRQQGQTQPFHTAIFLFLIIYMMKPPLSSRNRNPTLPTCSTLTPPLASCTGVDWVLVVPLSKQ